MNSERSGPRPLREIEQEVLEEGREWMRRRLQQKLQEQADQYGRVFPPEPAPPVAQSSPNDAPARRRRHR